jgi:C1A family cysteine protease
MGNVMAKKTSGRRSAAKSTGKSTSKSTRKDDHSTRRILNCIPSPDPQDDWQFHNAEDAGVLASAEVPSSRDLRDDTWWKIGDQGATGSCVGWATADSVLRWHFVQAGRIAKTDVLSTRFQWMAAKETDQFDRQPTSFIDSAGTSIKSALEVARKWGAVRDKELPFKSGRLYRGEEATFYAVATQLKIASYFNLGGSLGDWRSWLARNGPIVTRLDVDATWDAATANKGKLTTYKPSTKRGGHAVALVGYTPTGFIVRNSWGANWGDGGYAYASNAYAGKAFTEAYGVSA